MTEPTQFGFEQVSPGEKTRRVRGVFDSVAGKYDLMNDLMSAGLHRAWKRFAVEMSAVRAGSSVLDLAGGTGDLARLFSERVQDTGCVSHRHQRRDARRGPRQAGSIAGCLLPTVQCNAEALPFRRSDVRLRVDCLRIAQRHAEGTCARGDATRAQARRQRAGARILRVWPPLRRRMIGTASTYCRASASSWPTTRPAIATSPNRFASTRTRSR